MCPGGEAVERWVDGVGGTSDEGTAIDDCAGWSWLSFVTESANGGEEKAKSEKKSLLPVR